MRMSAGSRVRSPESNKLDPLRRVLLSAAQDTLGKMVSDVLITEIARQDS